MLYPFKDGTGTNRVSIYRQDVTYTGVQTVSVDYKSDYSRGTVNLYAMGNLIATATMNGDGEWHTLSGTISSYSGTGSIQIEGTVTSTSTSGTSTRIIITNVCANSVEYVAPTINSISLDSGLTTIGTSTGVTVNYTLNDTPTASNQAKITIDWGDSTTATTIDLYNTTSPQTRGHQYTETGTYTITVRSYWGTTLGSTKTATARIYEIEITASPNSGSAPLSVTFTPQLSDTSIVSAVSWNFGDGSTSSLTQPTHSYTSNGEYDVTLTVTTTYGTLTYTKEDAVNVGSNAISGPTTVNQGQTATFSWTMLQPDFTTHTYQFGILSGSTYTDVITRQSVTSATGSYSWSTTGYAGNYIPVIYRDSVEFITGGTVNVVAYKTLTVNLAKSGTTWTESTTVTILSNGTTVATQTTSTGSTQFSLATGTYSVTALTTGYAEQSATVQLTDTKSITIDFVNGSSEGGTTTGSGSQYAATFTTFRVYDSGTGAPIQGALIHVVGKAATNPVSWLAQLFGTAWGENILDTELSGLTDSNGVATFSMFQSIRYEVTATYNSITKTFSFQSSELSGEYPIALEVSQGIKYNDLSSIITTEVTPADDGITVSYKDSSLQTTGVTVTLYLQQDDEYTQIDVKQFISQDTSVKFNLASPSGQSYKVSIRATTGGQTYEKDTGVTYNGPRIPIGIPEDMYIWVCLIILLMLAGIGSLVTSPMYSFVVVFVAWILYAMGWMYQLGVIAPTILILATVLAIVYYMASRSRGGV